MRILLHEYKSSKFIKCRNIYINKQHIKDYLSNKIIYYLRSFQHFDILLKVVPLSSLRPIVSPSFDIYFIPIIHSQLVQRII